MYEVGMLTAINVIMSVRSGLTYSSNVGTDESAFAVVYTWLQLQVQPDNVNVNQGLEATYSPGRQAEEKVL